jgi:uncharacterized protein (DUF1810 family)
MDDPYDLSRFTAAQDAGQTYQQATAELRRGCKTGQYVSRIESHGVLTSAVAVSNAIRCPSAVTGRTNATCRDAPS